MRTIARDTLRGLGRIGPVRKGGTVVDVIVYVVAGLIIGALARLILPGKQSMSLVATLVLGVVAALIGGYLWEAVFPDNDGVAWIGSIIVAVVLLFIYERMVARRAV